MTALIAILLFAAQAATFDSTYRAGLKALNNDNFAMAQYQLEAAAKLEPRNPQVWLAIAQVYFKQNKKQMADMAAARAALLGPNDPMVQHALAYYYTETRNPAKAAESEARYAEKSPQDEDAFPRAIDLYLRAENPRAAIPVALKALARNNTSAPLHQLLARAYDLSNQFDKAVPEYRRAIQLRPFDEGSYLELGQAFLKRGKFAEALSVVDSSRVNFDKSAQLELVRGMALSGLRRYPEAIDSLLRTSQLDPNLDQTYDFLVRLIKQAGDKTPDLMGALASYASAKPSNYMSSFLYAKALAAQQAAPEQVEPLLYKSIQLNPGFWESHFELGAALEKQQEYPTAVTEFQKSIELNPKEAAPHLRLAGVYERLGKKPQAAAERATYTKLSAARPSP